MNCLRMSLVVGGALLLASSGCTRLQPPDVAPNLAVADQLREAFGGDQVAAKTEAAVVLPDPTGWGNVKGRVRLTKAIALDAKPVDKDTHVCGSKAPNEMVVCGPNGELKNVLIYLSTNLPSDAEPWVHGSYAAEATKEVDFDQKKCVFLNHVFTFRASQKLKVLNSDNVGHNTSIPDLAYNQLIPSLSSDNSAMIKASKKPAAVSCSIHPWMSAYVFASKTPYCTVTNDKGEFELINVPAGVDLEFTMWQEKVGNPTGAKVNDAEETWKKGKMRVRLNDKEDKQLEIVFDAAKFE